MIKEIETSKANDKKSFENDGRDFNLVSEGLSEVRQALIDEDRPDLAAKLNLKNVSHDIIRDTENYYNNLELEYNTNNENNIYNIFTSNTPLINSFKNYIKPSIYNNIIIEKDIFNKKYIS